MPDIGAFLEVAVGVNVLSQWKAVFDFVAKLYWGSVDSADEVAPVLKMRDRWLRRLWITARIIAVPCAALAYLALLCGVPSLWLPWFALAVGLPVPVIMLVLLPVVANVFGLHARYVSWRAVKKAEEAERLKRDVRKIFNEMVEHGDVVVKTPKPR